MSSLFQTADGGWPGCSAELPAGRGRQELTVGAEDPFHHSATLPRKAQAVKEKAVFSARGFSATHCTPSRALGTFTDPGHLHEPKPA